MNIDIVDSGLGQVLPHTTRQSLASCFAIGAAPGESLGSSAELRSVLSMLQH